eukprot:COSAG04_NODE_4965_length_1801_cov_4.786842_2_plen_232_part_00
MLSSASQVHLPSSRHRNVPRVKTVLAHHGKAFGAPPHVRDGLDDVDSRDDTHRRAAVTLPQIANVACQPKVWHPASRRQAVGNAAQRERKSVGSGVSPGPGLGGGEAAAHLGGPAPRPPLPKVPHPCTGTQTTHQSTRRGGEEASGVRAVSLRRTELHPPAALGNALGKPLICGQQHRPRVRRSEGQRLSGRGPTSARGSAAEIGGSGRRQRSAEGQRQARQGVSGCCGCG